MSLIFYVSSRPRVSVLRWASDPFLHVAGYLVLGVLSVRAFGGGLPLSQPGARAFFSAVLLASLYGIGDEWHQSFVPGRTASGWDVLADAFGALCGAAGVMVFACRATAPAGETGPT